MFVRNRLYTLPTCCINFKFKYITRDTHKKSNDSGDDSSQSLSTERIKAQRRKYVE